jgi:cytidylate kinase
VTVLVAIDGPAGSGKSTVSRAVAARLGFDHLETGALYRAVALAALKAGLDPAGEGVAGAELGRLAAGLRLEVGERVLLEGTDVTDDLRSAEVTRATSAVAGTPEVRADLVRRQRAWAEGRAGAVIEGRDIGSVVFPDADLKVYLTASEAERARRRSGDETASDVSRRDRSDSTRSASPLVVASDAVIVDTTGRDVDEVVEEIATRVGALASPGREEER